MGWVRIQTREVWKEGNCRRLLSTACGKPSPWFWPDEGLYARWACTGMKQPQHVGSCSPRSPYAVCVLLPGLDRPAAAAGCVCTLLCWKPRLQLCCDGQEWHGLVWYLGLAWRGRGGTPDTKLLLGEILTFQQFCKSVFNFWLLQFVLAACSAAFVLC